MRGGDSGRRRSCCGCGGAAWSLVCANSKPVAATVTSLNVPPKSNQLEGFEPKTLCAPHLKGVAASHQQVQQHTHGPGINRLGIIGWQALLLLGLTGRLLLLPHLAAYHLWAPVFQGTKGWSFSWVYAQVSQACRGPFQSRRQTPTLSLKEAEASLTAAHM